MSQAAAPFADDSLTARQFTRQARISRELVRLFIAATRSVTGLVYTRERLPMARGGGVRPRCRPAPTT